MHDELAKVHFLFTVRFFRICWTLDVLALHVAVVHQLNFTGLVVRIGNDFDAAALRLVFVMLLHAVSSFLRARQVVIVRHVFLIFLFVLLDGVVIVETRSSLEVLQMALRQVVTELLLLDISNGVNILELALSIPVLVEQVVVAAQFLGDLTD